MKSEVFHIGLTEFSQALAEVMDSLQALKPNDEACSASHHGDQLASVDERLQLLEKLLPCLKRRKPKDTKQVMETLLGMHWDDACHAHLQTLHQLTKRYKFTEAQVELSAMMLILKEG